jgi:hypothetical protein
MFGIIVLGTNSIMNEPLKEAAMPVVVSGVVKIITYQNYKTNYLVAEMIIFGTGELVKIAGDFNDVISHGMSLTVKGRLFAHHNYGYQILVDSYSIMDTMTDSQYDEYLPDVFLPSFFKDSNTWIEISVGNK